MTTLADHLSDDTLSTLLDAQLGADEERAARAHLAACAACSERFEDLSSVVAFLRELPLLDVPRDFSIGPRSVALADPPNVVRLSRFYTWSRTAAASLAALFVFLVAGTVYVSSTTPMQQTQLAVREAAPAGAPAAPPAAAPAPPAQPATQQDTPVTAAPKPAMAPAPQPTAAAAKPAQAPAPAAAVQRSAAQSGEAAGGAAANDAAATSVNSFAAPTADPSDQVKAATSVSPLATPTAVPVARERAQAAEPLPDAAAPLRAAAAGVGILAALALVIAFAARHRLQRAARAHLNPPQE